jgi:tetratricopeptide (TPR) repeat protein
LVRLGIVEIETPYTAKGQAVSDTRKASDSDSAPIDAEKLLVQARMALKTGISAYENENYTFAETLFVKALDLFEQANRLEEKEYFQCLHQVADTYFQIGRYFEAKSYYERLSVARLKNPESTDAQVVVALLKLASTYEKLGEAAEALTAFDLIMELAEKTIPNGHALFGVIFDSYEDVINRQIADIAERERRETIILQKREQFGFSKTSTDARWAHAITPASEDQEESDNVLSQAPEQLRKNLKAWTHADMVKPQAALEDAVQRANKERLAALQAREEEGERPREEAPERHLQAHLNPDMFRRKPHIDREDSDVEIVEKELGTTESFLAENADGEVDSVASISGSLPEAAPEASLKKGKAERGALKGAKRPNTDRKRFNPLPLLTVSACLILVASAVFVAHEFVKNSAVSSTVAELGALDYSGDTWVSSDSHKMLRCLSPVVCEYTVGGASASGIYAIKGQPGADKSILSDFFNGRPTKLIFDQVAGGLKASDGTVLYSETSKDRLILTKVQAIANFATYYFASHGHLYPAKAEDFQFGNTRFSWENPITAQTNKPIVKSATHTKSDFDSSFITAVKDMRDCKPVFDADTATGSPVGLIECMALVPAGASADPAAATPPAAGAAAAPAATTEADDVGCAFIIRAYDSDGKMIASSDPSKAFVIVLKNGISIDPIKVVHDEASAAAPLLGKVDVLITPLPPSAADKKSGTN